MKTAKAIAVLVVLFAIAFLFGSCELTTVSIMERLTQFATDLNNADRSSAYLNFDPTDTDYYAAIRAPLWWDTYFVVVGAGELAYSFDVTSYSDPLNVTGDMYGPPGFSTGGVPWPFRMLMTKVGMEWMIHELYLDGSPTATIKELR
jgi:hypothetical protein